MKQTLLGEILEVGCGLFRREQVLPDRLARAAMGKGVARVDGMLGVEAFQPGTVFRQELLTIPEVCLAGIGVEIVQVNLPEAGEVMVAGNGGASVTTHQSDTLVGPWPITNRIAETPECVEAAGRLEHSFERNQV
jgi:septum formation inhibitor-activating ATPase MinD